MRTILSYCPNLRGATIFLLFLLAFLAQGNTSFAQQKGNTKAADSAAKARQRSMDSARDSRAQIMKEAQEARQRIIDSARIARTRSFDSAKAIREHLLDSARASRQKFTDSMASVRKYKESRKYKDSVEKARAQRLTIIRNDIKAKTDSARTVRQRSFDSAAAIRNEALAANRAIMKQRADSLAAIRKYRESKRFADSTSVVRKGRADSIRLTRQAFIDSSSAARKLVFDAQKAERKRVFDSAAAVRKVVSDSLIAKRKVRADSLAKNKEAKKKQNEVKEKQKANQMKLALELKIKKKNEAWNNEKMLKKKWGIPRRPIQNLFTHYNYYFNANRKMEEADANMQRIARDDYDGSLLPLYSFNPDRDSTVLSSDMDSVIQKASLGIQIHDPRTKWADDLYILLGQAYFYKGRYEDAIITFKYVVSLRDRLKTTKQKLAERARQRKNKEQPSIVEKDRDGALEFLRHQSVHNMGLLWLAHTYTQSGKRKEAEAILDLLTTDTNFPDELKPELALEKAFLALQEKNYRDATGYLLTVSAAKDIPTYTRRRAAYIAGQLLEQQGKYAEAAGQFEQVSELHPKLDMDFYARKNKAYNLMRAGGDQRESIATMKRMLGDNKFAPYYEQIYFVLGQAAVTSGNQGDAINYLTKSTQSAKSTRKQKAISFASLGNLHFGAGNYELAKMAYDSASRFASAAPDDTLVTMALRRGKVLDGVAVPSYTIRTQDSLLTLAAMSEKDQRAVVRRYIRGLEQALRDSAAAAENAGVNAVASADPGAGVTPAASLSWYFSNPTLMQQGYNDFRKKWGTRPAVDNWRRSAAVTAGGNLANSNAVTPVTTGNTSQAGADGAIEVDENGIPTEAYLLAQIPASTEKQNDARVMIQRAYIDLSTAYVQKFDDYTRAANALDTLDARYAGHPHKAEEVYLRYLIALRKNDLKAAQQLSETLTGTYSDSKWAKLVRPTEDGAGLTGESSMVSTAALYEESYNLVQNRQYGEALNRVRTGQARKDAAYGSKFTMVEAMALAGSANYDQADAIITEFMSSKPSDSLRAWAEGVQKFVREQKKLQAPILDSMRRSAGLGTAADSNAAAGVAGGMRTGTPADTLAARGTAPGTANPALPAAGIPPVSPPGAYQYKPNEPHYFVFAYGSMESRVMGVKVAMSDFNSLKFSGQTLSSAVEPLTAAKGLLVTKGFVNAAKAKEYLREFRATPAMTREFRPNEYQLFLISESNLLKLKADKDLAAYSIFYQTKYR